MKPASLAIRKQDKIITLLTEILNLLRGWKHEKDSKAETGG